MPDTEGPLRELPPEALEKRVRFGCGALLGLFIGLSGGLSWWVANGVGFWLLLLVPVVICGWLASRRGDRFWERIGPWLWWWR